MRGSVLLSVGVGVLLFTGGANASVLLGPITNPASGHAYYLLDAATWTQSEAEAEAMGGHLATIEDADEEAWIFETFAAVGNIKRNLWIGLYDPDPANNFGDRATRRGEFVWVSGEPVTYTNWSPYEPNNPTSGDPVTAVEQYVHIWNPSDLVAGTWNNFVDLAAMGVTPMNGVVEIVPEPTSLALLGLGGVMLMRRRKS